MSRALAVVTACLVLGAGVAAADTIDQSVHELGNADASYKVRLAAALALSKSKDARAVIAIADALTNDDDTTIRRVSALALEKMIDGRTPEDALELGLESLERAAQNDSNTKVKDTAAKAFKALSGLRRHGKAATATATSNKPEVFVNIDVAIDASKKAPSDAAGRLTNVVKKGIEKTGYATAWPGGLPTQAELSSNKSRAFIVVSTVKKIDITQAGRQTQIACTVAIRIAPWSGKDGGEKWEANKAAEAAGSAKAMTGNNERDVSGGIRDCLEAVAEDVTARQVLPFLKRLAQAGS